MTPRALKTFTTKVDDQDDVMGADVNALQSAVEDIWNLFSFVGATELTIDAGVIEVTQNYHTVDTEADGASDNLDTITPGTGVVEAFILFLRAEHTDRSVVIKHNVGNILCVGNADFTLDDSHDFAILVYDEGLAKWIATYPGGSAVSDASDSVKGIVELADITETSAGTDADRAVTPDGLAGSVYGETAIDIPICDAATALTTGDGKQYITIPAKLAGFNIVKVVTNAITKSSSGDPTCQLSRGRRAGPTDDYTWVDVCSTRPVIQANEYSSLTGTEAVIDASNDDLLEGDVLRPDVDTAGTGAKGVSMQVSFRKP